MSIEGVHAPTQILWTNTAPAERWHHTKHRPPPQPETHLAQEMSKTDMRINNPQCRHITYCSALTKEPKETGNLQLPRNWTFISLTLPLQTPGAYAQTCFQQQVEAHSIKEKISCASQIKTRMPLFKFPFTLVMVDKSKKQDSSHRYATVPKMSIEQPRFKTATEMKTISICRLSMSSTNTEPVSEKENACGKESLSALCGFSPYVPPCLKHQRSRTHPQVLARMQMLPQVLGQPSICSSAFPNISLSALVFATEQ